MTAFTEKARWQFCLLFLFSAFLGTVTAQDDCTPLVSASSTSALAEAFSSGSKVSAVCVVSESEEHIAIRVNYTGFSDKSYKVIGKILNSAKKPLREFETITFPLEKGATAADLQFAFKKAGSTYTQPYVECRYLSIVVTATDDPLADLDLQGTSVFGNSYIYKLERKFRVGGVSASGGGSAVTVNVKLTPYKSAATIKE